ncbi:hypothetical protein C8T65DRAFT_738912 [Cerioporus squamosus]|nr:hypothetical protein C8T65DRAFT_738912 [Cerioporus squamosus]
MVMNIAPKVLKNLAEDHTHDPAVIDLCEQFMFRKEHVRPYKMKYLPYNPQLISDCIFTAVKRIVAAYPERDVTVIPEYDLTEPNGVPVTIKPSGECPEVKVVGRVIHVILHHPVDRILKEKHLIHSGGLVTALPVTERRDISCFIVIEAKEARDIGVWAYRLEAIGAALALISRTSLLDVRTCISNGQEWLFGILSVQDGRPLYMQYPDTVSVSHVEPDASLPSREVARIELSRVVGLLACWIDGQIPSVGS